MRTNVEFLGEFHKLSSVYQQQLLNLTFGDEGSMTFTAQESSSYHNFKICKSFEKFPVCRVWAASAGGEFVGWCLLSDPYINLLFENSPLSRSVASDEDGLQNVLLKVHAEFNIYVHEKHRGDGTASELYTSALRSIRSNGRTMEVFAHDTVSKRFFLKMSKIWGSKNVALCDHTDLADSE